MCLCNLFRFNFFCFFSIKHNGFSIARATDSLCLLCKKKYEEREKQRNIFGFKKWHTAHTIFFRSFCLFTKRKQTKKFLFPQLVFRYTKKRIKRIKNLIQVDNGIQSNLKLCLLFMHWQLIYCRVFGILKINQIFFKNSSLFCPFENFFFSFILVFNKWRDFKI